MSASAGQQASMKHLKIFDVSKQGDVIVVAPKGDGTSFRYQDLHLEANTVRQEMMKPGNDRIVLDLTELSYFGSEFIGCLVTILRDTRTRGGKACFCGASEEMHGVLKNMSLFKLWPYYGTREEAVDAIGRAV